jgi:hypothetical protein
MNQEIEKWLSEMRLSRIRQMPTEAVFSVFRESIEGIRRQAALMQAAADRLKELGYKAAIDGATAKKLQQMLKVHGACLDREKGGIYFDHHFFPMPDVVATLAEIGFFEVLQESPP